MKEEFKNELESIKQDALIEVNKAIDSNVMLQKKVTEKMVKSKSDVDKREAFERGNNVILSGLSEVADD